VFTASALSRPTLDRYVRDGHVRRLATGVYTSNVDDPIEEIVRRNVYEIGGLLFPGAVVSERSHVHGGMTPERELMLVADRTADVPVGPVVYRARRGPGPVEGDMPWLGSGLYFASRARGLLENARLTRSRGERAARALSRGDLETFLEHKLDTFGADGLNRLRDEARAIAPALQAEKELQVVEQLIGAILGTRQVSARSPLLRARQAGLPYDDDRLEIFRELRDALLVLERGPVLAPASDSRSRHLPFFEAYFSNYIEGTVFTLDEAIGIVYEHRIPQARPVDAHDILGTYAIVANVDEMTRLPEDADDFLEILHRRHAQMMERRPEILPGEFKDEPNQAGGMLFVLPERVQGTLVKGFEICRELTDPFARAAFMMFLVSEVHPFNDANGRIARIMMSAELVAAGEERIIVPPAMREGYVGALRNMSLLREPELMIRLFTRYQQFTNEIDFSDLDEARRQLDAKHVFDEPVPGGGILDVLLDQGNSPNAR
jgi:fido (protein-threonine AMPylation protein)